MQKLRVESQTFTVVSDEADNTEEDKSLRQKLVLRLDFKTANLSG